MADTKISSLTGLIGANAASGDLFPVVDISDATMAVSGTNKKMTRAEMFQNTPPIAVTGTLSASGTTNLAAGTMAAPGLVLEGETGTGLYRIGANNHGYAVSGSKVLDIASSGVTIFESFNAQTTSGLFGVSAYGGSSVKLTSSATMAYEVGASFEHQMRVNSVTVGSFSSTGLAVTGALDNTNGAFRNVRAAGADTFINHQTDGVNNSVLGFNNSGATNAQGVPNNHAYVGSLNGYPLSFTTNGATPMTLRDTGLAVTGADGITSTSGASSDTNPSFTAVGSSTQMGSYAFGTGSYRIAGGSAYAGLEFVVNNSVRGTLSAAALTLGAGVNLVVASGQGIDFSATANGSGTTTSEVLSDYEEGTWTPTFTGFSVDPTATGTYTKVGRQVTVKLRTTALGTSNSTGFAIGGLPYACGITEQGQICQAADNGVNGIAIAYINATESSVALYFGAGAANWTASGNKAAYFTITYFV